MSGHLNLYLERRKSSSFSLFNNEIQPVDNSAICVRTVKTKGNNAAEKKNIAMCGFLWYLQKVDLISNSMSIPWWKVTLLSFSETWGRLLDDNVLVDTQSKMYLKRNLKIINFSFSPCEIDGQWWRAWRHQTNLRSSGFHCLTSKQCGRCGFLFTSSDYLILLSAIRIIIFFLPAALGFHLWMFVCVCACTIMCEADFRIYSK